MTNKNQKWEAVLLTNTSEVTNGVTHFDNLSNLDSKEAYKALKAYEDRSNRHFDQIDCDIINGDQEELLSGDVFCDSGMLAEKGFFIPAIAKALRTTEDVVYGALVNYESDMDDLQYDCGHDFTHLPDVRYVIAKHQRAMILMARVTSDNQ